MVAWIDKADKKKQNKKKHIYLTEVMFALLINDSSIYVDLWIVLRECYIKFRFQNNQTE